MLYDINCLSLDIITLPSAAEERNRQCLDGARLCCQTKTEIYLPNAQLTGFYTVSQKLDPYDILARFRQKGQMSVIFDRDNFTSSVISSHK